MRRPRYLHGPQYSLRSLDVKGTLGVLASGFGPFGASPCSSARLALRPLTSRSLRLAGLTGGNLGGKISVGRKPVGKSAQGVTQALRAGQMAPKFGGMLALPESLGGLLGWPT